MLRKLGMSVLQLLDETEIQEEVTSRQTVGGDSFLPRKPHGRAPNPSKEQAS